MKIVSAYRRTAGWVYDQCRFLNQKGDSSLEVSPRLRAAVFGKVKLAEAVRSALSVGPGSQDGNSGLGEVLFVDAKLPSCRDTSARAGKRVDIYADIRIDDGSADSRDLDCGGAPHRSTRRVSSRRRLGVFSSCEDPAGRRRYKAFGVGRRQHHCPNLLGSAFLPSLRFFIYSRSEERRVG